MYIRRGQGSGQSIGSGQWMGGKMYASGPPPECVPPPSNIIGSKSFVIAFTPFSIAMNWIWVSPRLLYTPSCSTVVMTAVLYLQVDR